MGNGSHSGISKTRILGLLLFFVINGAGAACVPTVNGVTSPVIAGAGLLQIIGSGQVNGTPISGTGTGSISATGVSSNATAGALPGLTPASFPTGSLGSNTISTSGPVSAGSYGTLNTNGNPTVFGGGTYYINTLNTSGAITLGAGTYFINTLNLNGNVTVSGAVQLYIGNSLNTNANSISFNAGGNAGNLQLNLYPNAQFDTNGKNNLSFTGLIYAPYASSEIQFEGNNFTLTGALVTSGQVQLGSNTTVNFGATVQAQIAGLNCGMGGGGGIHHIEIDHGGSALTCSPQTVTIKACADAACTTLYTAGGVNVTLTPGGLTYAIDSTGINAAATVQQTTVGTATLDAVSSPAEASATVCLNTATNTQSCAMTFSSAGFLVTVPDHTSCTQATATIDAVQMAPGTGRCVPAYKNVTRAVNLYSSYISPATGTSTVTASTGTVSTAAPGTAHNLAFDATGRATITLSYPDAGKLTLTAHDTAPTGAAMDGSGTFVVLPATFAFSGIPAAPLTAGQAFNATVTAMNACSTPAATPNFNGTIALTSSNPLPGIGNATPINTALGGFANGIASTSLVWSEVGTFVLNANLSGYQGSALSVGSQAGVGRFHPAYFDVTATPACGTFSYAGSISPAKSGQPFVVTATARAAGGGVTANYAGAYAYDTTLSNSGVVTGFANNLIGAASFVGGVGSANVTYAVAVPQTAPLTLTLRAVDADTPAVSSSGHAEASMPVRSGRLKLSNAHGAETLNLPVPLAAEYWMGSGYAVNALDSCTTTSVNLALNGISTVATLNNPFVGGNGGLQLSRPNAKGYADITANAPAWLQYSWGGAAVTNPAARATFGVYKGSNEFIYLRENY